MSVQWRKETGQDGMKTGRLELRMTPAEKQAFQEAADLAGLTLSAWARVRLRRCAKSELQAEGRRVPFLAEEGTTDR